MSVMSKIKLVDERNGKDFCLELDYKERCYIFTTARAVRKEDFFEAFCSDTKKIPIMLQRSSTNKIEEVNDDSAIILTDSIPADKLFSFFMRERPELRKTEQILLHTRDKKCLLLKNVLMLRKILTLDSKVKLQMEAEAQINFRDKILKFVV